MTILSIQPQITKDFLILDLMISSNHFYVFIIIIDDWCFSLSQDTSKINFLINYLFFFINNTRAFFIFLFLIEDLN